MRNTNKFIVTWIEANGFIRGQATKSREEADRMYDYVQSTDATYGEIRKMGPLVKHFERKPEGDANGSSNG